MDEIRLQETTHNLDTAPDQCISIERTACSAKLGLIISTWCHLVEKQRPTYEKERRLLAVMSNLWHPFYHDVVK